MGVASNLVGICKGGRRELYILTSVRRIHGKRISDAELTIINVSSTNYTDSYVAETHVIEKALKERYLTGQSVL